MDADEYALMQRHASSHWWWRARRNIIEAVMRHWLERNRTYELLEVGCGSGANLQMLSRFGNVTGAEPDAPMLDYLFRCQPQFEILTLRIPESLNRKFDVICIFDVLEHLANDTDAINWCDHHLADGGWLIVTVPACPGLWSNHDVRQHHYRRYKKRDLGQLLETRFERKKLSYFNTLLLAPIAIQRRIGSRFSSTSDVEFGSHRGVLSRLLFQIFNAERLAINALDFPIGVSLIAVFRKSQRAGLDKALST